MSVRAACVHVQESWPDCNTLLEGLTIYPGLWSRAVDLQLVIKSTIRVLYIHT